MNQQTPLQILYPIAIMMLVNPLHVLFALAFATAIGVSQEVTSTTSPTPTTACIIDCSSKALPSSTAGCTNMFVTSD